MEENDMNFDQKELKDLTHALWEDAGIEIGGNMTLSHFKEQVSKHPGLANELAVR